MVYLSDERYGLMETDALLHYSGIPLQNTKPKTPHI
jgi:hypothetical protein